MLGKRKSKKRGNYFEMDEVYVYKPAYGSQYLLKYHVLIIQMNNVKFVCWTK